MPMTLDQIKVWGVARGIGHIAMSIDGGMIYTACRSWGTFRETKNRPVRICSKCRAALPKLVSAQPSVNEAKTVAQ